MKNILTYFSFLILVFTFSSCEDVVQIKLDEGSKLYVIDAFVNDLPGVQTIRVTNNDTYFSDREAPPVSGATVLLKDKTNGSSYNFSYVGNGNYIFKVDSLNPIAISGHQYELTVEIDGTTYTSIVTQNRGALIEGILVVTPEQAGAFGPPSKDTLFYCNVFAKDKTDANTDYYWVKTIKNDTLIKDLNITIDGTQGPVNSPDFDSTYFTPPISFLNFTSFRRKNTCEVQIHSIARDTYFFFVQASAQISNGGLFATTPENVKTNIVTPSDAKTKAIGWFNMSTVATAKVKIP
jgi:hypothetical protein